MTAQHALGAFVAAYSLVAEAAALLALDGLWTYVCNMADAWNGVKVEDFVMDGAEGSKVVVIRDVNIQGGEVCSGDVVAGPADRVAAFVVEREDVLVKGVVPELGTSVGDGVVEQIVGINELYFASYVEFFAHNVGEEHQGTVSKGGDA